MLTQTMDSRTKPGATSPLRICFLSSMHPALDKRVFDKEAISLAAAGFDVTHLCPGTHDETGVHSGVTITTFVPRKGIRGRLAQMRQLYRRAAEIDADAYHCNEVDSWLVGAALKAFRGKKCVFDVHEHYPSTFADGRMPDWMRPVVATGIRGLFVALAPFTDAYVLAKKTVGPDFVGRKLLVRNFARASAIRASDAVKPTGPLVMVHLGVINRVRGWPQMLDAFAAMQDQEARFVVVGEFNDGSRSDFDRRVAELGVGERVEVHDWMPFAEAFDLLVRSHVGLIAFQPGIRNHVYAMPHKMFDYMAAGLAVVCPSFAEEVAPIVPAERCGYLVDPSDVADFSAKLDLLAANRAETAAMGQRGREAVLDRYNWEAEAKDLICYYNSLAESVRK